MIAKVISGGQSGADRAGLFAARALGIPTGGWIPYGYLTEDGAQPSLAEFGLKPTVETGYEPRTRLNVQLSNVTVWFGDVTTAGYKCTRRASLTFPHVQFMTNPSDEILQALKASDTMYVVNVAGNRERKNPGMYTKVYDQLTRTWGTPATTATTTDTREATHAAS